MLDSSTCPKFVSQRARTRLLSQLVIVFAIVAAAQGLLTLVAVAALRGDIVAPWLEDAANVAGMGFGAAFFAVAFVFARFSTQAHRNVAAIGRPVKEFSETSMGWWYFVPILNLIRPYQAMRAVWDASRPRSAMRTPGTWSSAPEVSSWWTAWVIAQVLSRIASGMVDDASTDDRLAGAAMLDVVSTGAMIVAGFLLRRMALELAELQDYAWTDDA